MLVRVGDRVYAGNILNGSAAYDAGIKWFDEIISIDGRPLERWTREEVDRLLEEGEVGTVHKITYRRMEDDPKTVEVTLRDVL
jgi:C-terminal processing protease CtpA/Prc